MRFSYWPSSEQPWEQILESARHAEAGGWDGIWVADHFMNGFGDDLAPHHECWTIIAALAASVPRVRLGSLVAGNTYRHPVVLAKMAATIDEISGGRVVLGLGAGWQENEHAAYGFDLGTAKSRLDRLEEAAQIIRSLLTEERTSFAGEHYHLENAPLSPKPAAGSMPFMVAGGGEQRTMRIAARYADEWNTWGTPAHFAAKSRVLDQRCEEVERDPDTLWRSTNALLFMSEDEAFLANYRGLELPRPALVGTPSEVVDIVGDYAEAGVDELIIPDFNLRTPSIRRAVLDQFIHEVAPAFR
jgi:F420-dependent oxidoreductase-like protein